MQFSSRGRFACLPVLFATAVPITASTLPGAGTPTLQFLSRYDSGLGAGPAEISAFDAASKRLFVVNAANSTVDIVSLVTPAAPALVSSIDVDSAFSTATATASPNSVAVDAGLVAIAVQLRESDGTQRPGIVAFYDVSGALLDTAPAGALPDMLAFTPNGLRVVVANEGEPNGSYTHDPEGSVTIIDTQWIRLGLPLPANHVRTASFAPFNDKAAALRAAGVRIYGPNATVAQDLEPEYIAFNPSSQFAYVTLQENNAIAVVNLASARVTRIEPLGYKDWSASALDASDRDNVINIQPWPVLGMYQPDAIAAFKSGGAQYLVTANEGDAREYAGFAEETRVRNLTLDPTAFPNAAFIRQDANLGRLTVTTANGNTDGDSEYEALYTLGGRSFSVWRVSPGNTITQVFDSGDDLEQITAAALPARFNGDPFDTRSDNKGPEPEGIVIGEVDGQRLAFVGLERIGGVMLYDLTVPNAPVFLQYVNTSSVVAGSVVGDVSPEGLAFVPASDSPIGVALLIVSFEVSGTVGIFTVQ